MGRLRPRTRAAIQRRQIQRAPSGPAIVPSTTPSAPSSASLAVSTACPAPAQVTFPSKLVEMLNNEGPEVIRWSDHGLSFFVQETDFFVGEILPKYFRHSKLTSFQRQLNLYGFRRISKGADTGAYFHPHFRRDRPELVRSMKRLPGQGATATAKYLPLYYSGEIAYKDVTSLDDKTLPRSSSSGSSSPATTVADESGGSDDDCKSDTGDDLVGSVVASASGVDTVTSSMQAMGVPNGEAFPAYGYYGYPYYDPSHHYYYYHQQQVAAAHYHHRPYYGYPYYPTASTAAPAATLSTTTTPAPVPAPVQVPVSPSTEPVAPPLFTSSHSQSSDSSSSSSPSPAPAPAPSPAPMRKPQVSSVCSDLWKLALADEENELSDLKEFDMESIFHDMDDGDDLFGEIGMDLSSMDDEPCSPPELTPNVSVESVNVVPHTIVTGHRVAHGWATSHPKSISAA